MKRESGGFVLPVAVMAVIALMAWFFVFKSSPSPQGARTVDQNGAPLFSPAPPDQKVPPATKPSYKRAETESPMGWRTLYRDNWEFLCPVLGHQVVDPEEACRLIAAPARLGPIVVRDSSVKYDKPFTVKRNPSVPLVKYNTEHPVMSLPEYVGPRFLAEKIGCDLNPGKWTPTHRPVIDPQGRLIRYDPEQVRIFCGGGK
ncbi:MAG: hypothetical protein M0041_04560 [Nitrospiraceae bacterium]|nr:hypothetical protein [Nitrospiraceae bacterium]